MLFQTTSEFAKVIEFCHCPGSLSQLGIFCKCKERLLAHHKVSRENTEEYSLDKYIQNLNKSNSTENY